SLVETYLGAAPIIDILESWWSFPGRPVATEAQSFHLDYDDIRFCKLFIYLTDVDMESGPHVYIKGTNSVDNIYALREKHDAKEFDLWYSQKLRKTDEEVQKYIGIEPTYFTGKAGTCFIADTRGIHKGLLPKTKIRMLSQVEYGITPLP